jgi:hypothetical protein
MGGGVSTLVVLAIGEVSIDVLTYPTVLAAASTSVGGSVGIAKQVSIGGTASSIRGVLCLSLLRYRSALGLGFRVENVTTDDRLTSSTCQEGTMDPGRDTHTCSSPYIAGLASRGCDWQTRSRSWAGPSGS